MKRNPIDTRHEQVAAFSDAKAKLSPPPGLSKVAAPFWQSIVGTRAPGEWSPADVPVAAQLAEDQALLVALRSTLDAEGWTDGAGRMRAEATLLNATHTRVLRAMRLLQLHPIGRSGSQVRDLAARRAASCAADDTLAALEDNPLIKTH